MECWVSFKLYFGKPWLAVLLVASALYLIITEKDLRKKIILGILPLVIMAGFLFPVTKKVYVAALDDGSDTYYRILWLIPMYVVIGYAACRIIFSFSKSAWQRIALVVILAVIAMSGSLVYMNQYMSVAENLYHIPQSVIDVCDKIAPGEGGPRVRAVFPSEMVHFVRQYDTKILMPYGREMIATQWDYYNVVYEAMEKAEVINAKELLDATRLTECTYIVLRKDRKIDKDLTELGLELFETVGDYNIYLDPVIMEHG